MVARQKQSKGTPQNPDEAEFYEAYHDEISQADATIEKAKTATSNSFAGK